MGRRSILDINNVRFYYVMVNYCGFDFLELWFIGGSEYVVEGVICCEDEGLFIIYYVCMC